MGVSSEGMPRGNAGTLSRTVPTMIRIIKQSRADPEVRRAAELVISTCAPTTSARIVALFDFVQNQVGYVNDPNDVEWVTSPKKLLQRIETRTAWEDCESMVVLLASLMESIGIRTRIVLTRNDPNTTEYTHVFMEAKDGAEWVPLDPTPPYRAPGTVPAEQRGRLVFMIDGVASPRPIVLVGALIALAAILWWWAPWK